MNKKQLLAILSLIVLGTVLAISILRVEPRSNIEEPETITEAKNGVGLGGHGGQVFVDNNFKLEILLTAGGEEPHFQVYLFDNDKILPPNPDNVSILLTRPTGEPQKISFVSKNNYLQSSQAISEPHIFEAVITANHDNNSSQFLFVKEEGKIVLTDQQITESNISTQTTTSAKIKRTVVLPGEVRFNEDNTAHVVPRLAGVVESVNANLGQQVKKGQVLAVIASTTLSEQRSDLLSAEKRLELALSTYAREKHLWEDKISAEQDYLQAKQVMHEAEIALHNAQQKLLALGVNPKVSENSTSLNRYEIRAPFDGMVVEKHIALGEAVKEDTSIFVISDLSTVWAEIIVSAKDLDAIRVGEKVTIKATALESKATGIVSYVGSLMGEQTRTAKARVTLANPHMAWRPGLFINVEVTAEEKQVPIAVTAEAIQHVNDNPTVFVRVPGGFVPQPVSIGIADDKFVEIVQGLKADTQYAVNGSFVIKSEQGKSSAEHED